jgi:DnaJ-domain-containing protein 1
MANVYPTATKFLARTTFLFPYDPEMVEEMKTVPIASRSYDPEQRMWTISDPYADRMLDRFLRRFPHATVNEYGTRGRDSAPPPPPKVAPATPHATLYVLPSAPIEVIEASYKALVKKYHPDRLPAPERAQGNATLAQINVAFARLTGGR